MSTSAEAVRIGVLDLMGSIRLDLELRGHGASETRDFLSLSEVVLRWHDLWAHKMPLDRFVVEYPWAVWIEVTGVDGFQSALFAVVGLGGGGWECVAVKGGDR